MAISRAGNAQLAPPSTASSALATRALKDVRVGLLDREVGCTALFDAGSGVTAVQRGFFEGASALGGWRSTSP